MKLKVVRGQGMAESGMLFKSSRLRYSLQVKLELSPEEDKARKKYGMHNVSVEFRADQIQSKPVLPEGSSSAFHMVALEPMLTGILFHSDSSIPLRKLEGDLKQMSEQALAVLVAQATWDGEETYEVGEHLSAALRQRDR